MQKKIVFMGTPEFSVQTLEVLFKSNYKVECVYTQPPKKSFRGQKVKASPIEIIAKKFNLNIRNPIKLDNKDYKYLKSIKPFIVIVVAYGQIIPKNFLELSEMGFLNIHASLLPKWRGAAPIQRSIMNQDEETGISFMKIEEGLDEGPYLKQIKIKIDNQTTSKVLSEKLSKIGAENILECLSLIENGEAKFIKQNASKATYAKKINKKESKINWEDSAKNILSKINGLNPSPGAWFEYGGLRYKVWKAVISDQSGKAGEIIDEKLTIACKEKSLRIIEIQKEGKNKMLTKDFLLGIKISLGDKVS
tara:strand:+ start:734 stop:1651 length:918 start_codon:yes stop_codon:yes gene_type:complete